MLLTRVPDDALHNLAGPGQNKDHPTSSPLSIGQSTSLGESRHLAFQLEATQLLHITRLLSLS